MADPRLAAAEHRLDWPPLPTPPRRYRSAVATAAKALVAYVLDADQTGLARVTSAYTGIAGDRRFGTAPEAFRLAVLVRGAIVANWSGVGGPVAHFRLALELLRTASDLVPETGEWRARVSYVTGNTLLNLYMRTGDRELLAAAVDQARLAVRAAPTASRLVALCRTGLASALMVSARTVDDAAAVDEAVAQATAAVETAGASPMGHRFKYVLAETLASRNDRRGGLADLDQAIRLLEEARLVRDHMMSPGSARVVDMLLCSLLRRRFLRTKVRADIDRAVGMMSDALAAEREPVPSALTNLGNMLITRFQAFGDLADLAGAVDLQTRAVAATEPGDWQRPSRHNNAGNAFSVAWRATGDPGLGERAIAEYRAALALTGPTAPERASREYNLGLSLRAMVESAGEPAYLDEAVAMFRAAVRNGMVSAVEWALGAARNWGEWAASREAWPEACEAYEAGLAATEELFRAQVLRADKEAWLADAQGLPTEAAYALTRVGRVDAAVEAVETGRARLVSEVLDQGRADLSRLDGLGFGALVEAYRRSASELADLIRSGASPAVLRAARAAVDEAVEGIRAVPGYARFLARPSVADVRACVPPGTAVVYLACARAGGVALVVDDEGVRSVDLKADAAAVDKRVEALAGARGHPAWEGVLDAVGRWAWDAVVEPVASILRARRVVVVASGRLAMVPLHAAWHPTEDGREYLVDRWILSYAPNARAFDASRRGAGVAEDSALVVAGPEPSALAPVAHAAVEAACVARWYPNSTVLSGARADRASVLAALPGASVAHFVCHGIARTAKPLTSALVLAGDEELTLADILGLSAVRARLAVLSACDTDLPGIDLPDETVSLPTGLLQAGFAGVVATQWPVWGEPAVLLTTRFHHLRHVEGQPPAEALRLAQIWLRDTTNAEKVADLAGSEVRPVARMLRLREPGDRPYRHPRVWAAFSYHGA